MRPRRPLRSVYLGNPRYLSVYGMGVAQAMGVLGHWHRTVSLFDGISDVEKQISEMRPDVIWTHMALWPPPGALSVDEIVSVLSTWKRRGTAVYLHDGDPRERDLRTDHVSAFSIALVNRTTAVSYYGIPSLRWPYAGMVQKEIAPPRGEWRCSLLFAGLGRDDELYGERTELVRELQKRLGTAMRVVSPGNGDVNNRMLVADVAPSAKAVLGYARPSVPGWIDTRVFQYPSAGGLLIHDDAGEFLEPDVHYLKYDRNNAADSVLDQLARAYAGNGSIARNIRVAAFEHMQKNHTWVHRVNDALDAFYGRSS